MFTMTRRQARSLRAVARKCVPKGAGRSPDPVLTLTVGPDGPFAYAAVGDVTVGCRLPAPRDPAAGLSMPLSALAACEGSDPLLVTVDADATGVRLSWTDRGQSRTETAPMVRRPFVPPAAPPDFGVVSHAFLAALHEAGRCAAGEDTKYAVSRVHVRGAAGQVVGTDGKQALVTGGFRLPFHDDVLVPALPVFGLKELARDRPVRVGRTEAGLCVGAGEWLVWLPADAAAAFPDVDGVVRRTQGGTRLVVGDADAARLVADLPKMPEADAAYAPVTVSVGPKPGLTAGAARVRLAESEGSGPAANWTMNRAYLHRALLLGFRDFSTRKATSSLVAANGAHTYLFALLDPDPAVPSSPKSVDDSGTHAIQGVSRMRPPDPARRPEPASDDDEPDLFSEMDALRAALGDALTRAGRVAGLLKHDRKRRKAVASVLSSLQQLKLGAGG